MMSSLLPDDVRAFVDARASSCVELPKVEAIVENAHLDEDEAGTLYEELEARGIELSDDCGQRRPTARRS